MRVRGVPLAVLLLASAALAPRARGQAWSDPGLQAGVFVSAGRSQDSATVRPWAGATLRYRLTGGVGLEGSAGYRQDVLEARGVEVARLSMVPVTGSVDVFFLSRGRVQPFLEGGAGYYYVRVTGVGAGEALGSSSQHLFGFHAGAAVDLRLSRGSSLVLGGRYTWLDVTGLTPLEPQVGEVPSGSYWEARAAFALSF